MEPKVSPYQQYLDSIASPPSRLNVRQNDVVPVDSNAAAPPPPDQIAVPSQLDQTAYWSNPNVAPPDVVSNGQNTAPVGNLSYSHTPAPPPIYPQSPPGSVSGTPRQLTGEAVNNLNQRGELANQQGQAEAEGLRTKAAIEAEKAAEDRHFQQDYHNELIKHQQRQEQKDAERDMAYQRFSKAAGSLSDPESQYWEDKGVGAHILGVLAAAFSGFGQSLTGQGGNAALEHIQKSIANNYAAHKQNIEDLYQRSVEAGKIADTAENRGKFNMDAMQNEYSFGAKHWENILQGVADTTNSKVVATKALATKKELEGQGIQVRQALSHQEAQAAATGMAASRAELEKSREFFAKQVAEYSKDDPDTAAYKAARDTANLFTGSTGAYYDNLAQRHLHDGEGKPEVGRKPEYDENGEVVVPKRNPATGRSWKGGEEDKYVANAKKDKERQDTFTDTLSNIDELSTPDNVKLISPSYVEGLTPNGREPAKTAQTNYKALVDDVVTQKWLAAHPDQKRIPPTVLADQVKQYLPNPTYETEETTKLKIDKLKKDYKEQVGVRFPNLKNALPPTSDEAKKKNDELIKRGLEAGQGTPR